MTLDGQDELDVHCQTVYEYGIARLRNMSYRDRRKLLQAWTAYVNYMEFQAKQEFEHDIDFKTADILKKEHPEVYKILQGEHQTIDTAASLGDLGF